MKGMQNSGFLIILLWSGLLPRQLTAQQATPFDRVAGQQDYEFQKSIEEQARGDLSTLRQFIADSLRLLYDERYHQLLDSLESHYENQIQNLVAEQTDLKALNQSLLDSLRIQKSRFSLLQSGPVSFDPVQEEKLFQFTKMLKMETNKRKTGKLFSSEIENIAPYQLDELAFYYRLYYPDARADSVLDFITQVYIRTADWAKAELYLIKFLYLHSGSPLYEEVKNIRSAIFQTEKYFKPYMAFLSDLVNSVPQEADQEKANFQFVEMLKDWPDAAVRENFIAEGRQFLLLYPYSATAPLVQQWIAETQLQKGQPHSAFLTWQKIMLLYPDKPVFQKGLYLTGQIQQQHFAEFENAIKTCREYIRRFPDDTLAADCQYRLAKMYDENLNNWEAATQEDLKFADRYPQAPQTIAVLNRRAVIQATQMSMVEEAVTTYKLIDQRYPDTPAAQEALLAAGNLYNSKARYEQAIEVYQSIFQKYPQSDKAVQALEKTVVIYNKKIKNLEKTIETLNLIIANYPGTKAEANATKLVKKLEKPK